MRRLIAGFAVLALGALPLGAQSAGVVTGVVREAGAAGQPLVGARVSVDNGRFVTVTDPRGVYRVRELVAGWHTIRVAAIGYRPQSRDSVLIRAGQTTPLDFALQADPVGLEPLEVIAERVPGSELLKLPNCGHSPHRDQPAAVLGALDGFVRRVTA